MCLGVLVFQRGHALVEVLDLLTQFGRLLLFRNNRVSHFGQLGVAFLGGHRADLLSLSDQVSNPGGEHRVVDDHEVEQHQEHQRAEDDRRFSVNTFLSQHGLIRLRLKYHLAAHCRPDGS